MAKRIPTYEERLANIHTIDDLDEQMDEALRCMNQARFDAIGAQDCIKRFKLERRAESAKYVMQLLRANESDIEAELEAA